MSYPSQPRYPYGIAVHPVTGAPMPVGAGMAAVPGGVQGYPGMTPIPVNGALVRGPNGMNMNALYQTEKGLYAPAPTAGYPGLGGSQAGLLTQSAGSLTGQPFYGGAQPAYIPVSSPGLGQTRYIVSSPYALAGASSSLVSSPTVIGATGYPLTASATAGGYALQTTPVSMPGSPVSPGPGVPSSLSTQAGSQYPTYLNPQLTPLHISAGSQNPYVASATGHPLYPGSPYAGLQVQQSQVAGGLPTRMPAMAPGAAGAGLALGYQSVQASQLGAPAFYQAP